MPAFAGMMGVDILVYAKQLKASGVPEGRPKPTPRRSNLAVKGQIETKADRAELRGEMTGLRAEIAALRTKFQRDLGTLENRLAYRMAGLLALTVAIVGTFGGGMSAA